MLKGDKAKKSPDDASLKESDLKMTDGNEREFKMLGFTPR